jgi:hypothetical protein
MRVARFRALYGPPESWRHILIDMLAVRQPVSPRTRNDRSAM